MSQLQTSTQTPELHRPDRESNVVPLALLTRETRLGLKIIFPLALSAFILSGVLFGWSLAAIGGLMGFALMLLISLPLCLASMTDEVEEH